MEAKSKSYLFAITSLSLIILFFTYLNLQSSPILESSGEIACRTIKFSDENGFNIVFLGNKEEAEVYSDFFLQTEPYTDFADKINLFNVDEEPECTRYKGIAVICDSPNNFKKASACASPDVVVALKKEEKNIRASAQNTLVSLNTEINYNSVITHEIGHVFGLVEEYTPASLPRMHPNCQSSESGFNYPIDEANPGCSREDYLRPSKASVMRTLSTNSYDTHNAKYITDKLEKDLGKSGPQISGKATFYTEECANREYLVFNTKTKERTTQQGCLPGNSLTGDWYFTITKDGLPVYSDRFSPYFFTDIQTAEEDILSGETYELTDFNLYIPFPSPGDEISVFDEKDNVISKASLHDAGALACVI